jgi:DNA-binding NtrC family response regulator
MVSIMEPRAEKPAPESTTGSLLGVRILIVEDDFFIAMELESILSDAGGQVVKLCRTLTDAVASAAAEDFSVAILDFQMGEETTVDVAELLAGRHVPFAFYTGQADAEPLSSRWPDCKVVSKPARPRALISAIADLTRRDRASA